MRLKICIIKKDNSLLNIKRYLKKYDLLNNKNLTKRKDIYYFTFYLSKDSGSTFYLLGTIAISAAYQGLVQSGIPCFDSSKGIAISADSSIYVAVSATVTADKTLNFSALGSDY